MQNLRRRAVVLELGLLGAGAALAWAVLPLAGARFAARAAAMGFAAPADGVHVVALLFSAGVVALAAGRAIGLARASDPLGVPLLLPAAVLACLFGAALHAATIDVRGGRLVPPSAGEFAQGFLLGAVVAAVVLAFPRDPAELVSRLQVPTLLGMIGLFVALALFGTGPGESGTRVNLGPLQPIEALKPAFVAFLAVYLGRRAAKLRWQRRRRWGLKWPRPKLLFPAIAFLLLLFAGLFLVRDLGPTLILTGVFLGMSYAVTRASGWIAIGLALLAGFLLAVVAWPELLGGINVATRIRMWWDPWENGLTHGHQLGEGLWAFAAGGWTGQGLGEGNVPVVAAGKTDLALALLAEQTGLAGLILYLGLLAVIVISGFRVAARNRTPERVLLAGGLSLMVLVQWAIIHGGTLGILPLTGIVVPFLSSGKSSMVAFLFAAALVARLADDGRARAETEEIDEVQGGARALAFVALAVLALGVATGALRSIVEADRLSAMGIVTRLADGTVVHRQNPRLVAIAGAIRRGTLADRNGEPLAHSPEAMRRLYPLADALGTLVGVHPSRVLLPPWALERRLNERLRGYPEREGGPRYRDYDPGAGDAALPWPDLRGFVPLLHLGKEERARRVRELDAAIETRSVTLTLDARLQREVSSILRSRLRASGGQSAAAVVLDVDTGEVLARAQTPDVDPADPTWQAVLLEGDPVARARLSGAHGPLPDRMGLRGVFQAGSIAKIATALAAARRGWEVRGAGCDAEVATTFSCGEADEQGPLFTRPGWEKPVHDHEGDRTHGTIDVVQGLAVSCNVYFAQLGLALGREAFLSLRADGVELGYQGAAAGFEPGPEGSRALASTGFGQGAMAMSVLQAARLVAAVGSGGVYRRCPPTMEQGLSCEERPVIADSEALRPILAGMRRVMTAGTGRRLSPPPGVRVYGKTGTADARGFRGEEPFGIAPLAPARPHSWFVALAEAESSPACAVSAPGRLAVAVVVTRGGTGASAAGPAAMEILAQARELGYLGGAR